jgi:uncharacterized protein YuzE
MKVSYDPESDAAYVALVPFRAGQAKRSVPLDWNPRGGMDLIIDLDREGKVVGIEFPDASQTLRASTLASAELPPTGVRSRALAPTALERAISRRKSRKRRTRSRASKSRGSGRPRSIRARSGGGMRTRERG